MARLLVTGKTKAEAEQLLNNYYFSDSYKIEGTQVRDFKGFLVSYLKVETTETTVKIFDTFFNI